MFKLVSSALLLFLAVGALAAPQKNDPPGLGEQCETIITTIPCAPGLKCCILAADDGRCFHECPA
ncbi:hypothetical protein V5O48_003758 [Marasmius crinis-equi]|uniref:Uncharacterized protein n=1 Tax=Marasmius crinis-equi TaxID=585013 RepID=A0ABR3FRY3_9AGAR